MYNKKLKIIMIMFLVGLAGVIYFGYNTSGYTSEKDNADVIFNDLTVTPTPTSYATDKLSKEFYKVYVCGCVKKPGVYTLPEGSRLYEYLELAGGYTPDADTEYENLARTIKDGEKVYFPSKAQVSSGEVEDNLFYDEIPRDESDIKESDIDEEHSSINHKININTAGVEELTTLTGIGESRAKSIIEYRQANGSFKSIEDIMLINGIKESVYEKIKDNITV